MSSNSIDSTSEIAAAPASKKSVWIQRVILVAAILVLVAVYFLVPAVHEWVGSVFAMFATGDFSAASEFMAQYGPDSYIGRTAAVMLGSTETTFYVIAVYFGAAGIKHTRWAVPAALCADVVGFAASAFAVRLLWGGTL